MTLAKALLVSFICLFTVGACTDQAAPIPSEPPVERAGDNSDFVEVSSAELRALPEGQHLTVDLRPDGAAFAIEFLAPADLDRVWVLDYSEETGAADEYILGERVELAAGQLDGKVVFGHGDMAILDKNDRGCVCIRVCCTHWRCYCTQEN